MKKMHNILLALLSSALLSLPVYAGDAEDKGLAIATEAKSRDIGWEDSTASMEMVLKNQHGQTSSRMMHIKTLEQLDDGDKSLTVFDSPSDVKGTAFLSFSHIAGNDEQWLYLPALKRVKRISSRNKSGSFMGSEFSFEDLTSFEIEKYNFKYIKDDVLNGVDCFVLHNYPKDRFSGYKKRVTWVDKEHYRIQKVDFYDRKDSLLKTLTMSEYHQFLDHYWRPGIMNMVNHQSGKSTVITWTAFKFKNNLKEQDFNKNALKRAR
ncbi:MAG: outer membrane lipoprotein-sorting protein [bacterium]